VNLIAPCKGSLLQGFDKRLSLGSLKDLRNLGLNDLDCTILSLGSLRDLSKKCIQNVAGIRYQVSQTQK